MGVGAAARGLNRLTTRCFAIVSAACFFLFLQVLWSPAHAVPIDQIEVGDSYFIHNVFSGNDLVTVRKIDYNRNVVKIEYATGGVDWVAPSKLLSNTQSREADFKDGVVGTTVVLGALWAILDPEGFKGELRKQQSRSAVNSDRSKTTVSSEPTAQGKKSDNVVAVTAVPFSPVVVGSWQSTGEDWRSWAEKKISSTLGSNVSIESVRFKRIPFYSNVTRNVVLVEAAETGRTGAYYIVHDYTAGKVTEILGGKGSSIHEINRKFGLYLSSPEQAAEYLKFFTSCISADDGIFLIVEPDDEYLSSDSLREIGISAMQVISASADGWEIGADVIYNNYLYRSKFFVSRGGLVEMKDDTPKKQIDFRYIVVMDGSRRVYVSK